MKYSAHKLLSSPNGFIRKIDPLDQDISYLMASRRLVRQAIREAFDNIAQLLKLATNEQTKINPSMSNATLMDMLRRLTQQQKQALLKIKPRFAPQGSFIYRTLNNPCHLPPQQLDLDDGVYLPTELLKDKPIVSKDLFFQIVDGALKNLANRQPGWKFVDKKPTCARIEIRHDMHIDVPLYAIPYERFQAMNDSTLAKSMDASTSSRQLLNKEDVFMAMRTKAHWIKSDPAQISEWFRLEVRSHDEILRRVCRYLKAWRDNVFQQGGPSSITLMACAVDTFNAKGPFKDDSHALLVCSSRLRQQFTECVASPVDASEPVLYPRTDMSDDDKLKVLDAADHLHLKLKQALLYATSRQEVIAGLRHVFGVRLPNLPELVLSTAAAGVMAKPAKPQPQPNVNNMSGG